MMLKLLGLMDILAAANLFIMAYGLNIPFLVALSAGYLIIKGMAFIKDFISVFEILIGVFIIFGFFFTLPKTLLVIFGLLILQKGIFSLFA